MDYGEQKEMPGASETEQPSGQEYYYTCGEKHRLDKQPCDRKETKW